MKSGIYALEYSQRKVTETVKKQFAVVCVEQLKVLGQFLL